MTQPSRFSLNGRTALITGAAGLLGEEHCLALLECGAHVVATDVHAGHLSALGGRLRAQYPTAVITLLELDVADAAHVSNAARRLAGDGTHVDILVNNAAINPAVDRSGSVREASRLEHFDPAEWERQIRVGLTGAFLCSQVFGTSMAQSRGGVILNIASDLSVIAPDQRLYRQAGREWHDQPVKPVTYSVIKSGLVGLTRYLATYWADRGVRANALSPGGVYAGQPEAFVKDLSELIPMGRMATRSEYRAAIQFLCSDASSYMNGQNIVMDGGRSAW